jgi:hypothetical protein
MFALVEREHRYSYLCGAHAGHVSYTPAIVSSVTRDSIAREVRLVGRSSPLKQRDWRRVTVDSAGNIADPEGVAGRLVAENGHAIEYRDHAEALAAIKRQPASAERPVLKTPPKTAPEFGGIAGLGSTPFACPTTTSFEDPNISKPKKRSASALSYSIS